MTIEQLKNALPECAKDIKLNLSTILTEEGAPDLTLNQILGVALACAYTTKNAQVIDAMLAQSSQQLSEAQIQAAKAAAIMMAMNNIYYRFTHLVSDKSYSTMPAKLRMSVIGNPGITKVDFELFCLAVSAMNGCGLCLDAHAKELNKAGVSNVAIQSAVRIASVLNAVAVGLDVG